MRKLLIAAAAGLMTLSALPASAGAAPQERPYNAGPMNGPMNHGPQHGPGPVVRPGPDGMYGTWDDHWGARPPAPPRGWTRHNDWYRHVRACSQRYRSYNPRTDSYTVRRGVFARCRL
ncbi:MAG: BA14K family protein [Caulobacteraceae bacterium]|nr:BA14K family protein [Caulobacteraceae bacterium]